MHPQHRKVYQTRLQRERQKVLGLIGDMNSNRFAIFRSLTLLRQLSLHAGLVDEAHAGLASAKIDALLGQLHEVTGGGHRALVFSQFTGFLGKVRERLEAEGMPYCYLDGSTRDRAAVVRRFKDGTAPVFLISLKAGGFGLNLTEADYCFLLDPWWNPATEAQAVDRAHRIGQTRNVMVYRLVAKDTIEEKVMALKARKARLFSSVMDDGNVVRHHPRRRRHPRPALLTVMTGMYVTGDSPRGHNDARQHEERVRASPPRRPPARRTTRHTRAPDRRTAAHPGARPASPPQPAGRLAIDHAGHRPAPVSTTP